MFGLRPDGKQVKNIDPIQRIIPHIMRARHDAQNLINYVCPCEPLDEFINDQLEKGEVYNYMHLVMSAMVRTFARFPRLNRFVMNGRIYKRNDIMISLVIKKNMSAEAPDSLAKLTFTGLESLPEVQRKIDDAIEANNDMEANNGTEKLARLLTVTPNFLISFLVKTIGFLDRHGMLPNAILRLSPFHTSLFVTNMKSIKSPSIFHHIYDFGTTSIFMAMGKEAKIPVVNKNDEIVIGKRMTIGITTDERFCDGFYFVSAMKYMDRLLRHPHHLLERIDSLTDDVAVIDGRKARKMAAANKNVA